MKKRSRHGPLEVQEFSVFLKLLPELLDTLNEISILQASSCFPDGP